MIPDRMTMRPMFVYVASIILTGLAVMAWGF